MQSINERVRPSPYNPSSSGKQNKPLVKRSPLLLTGLLLTLSLTACASGPSIVTNPDALKKTTPETVKEPCEGAPLPQRGQSGVIPDSEWSAFGIRQTGQLELCEGKRKLAVDSDNIHNEYVEKLREALQPRPWWKFWAAN